MKFSQLLLFLFGSCLLIMPASCGFIPYSIETIEQQIETGAPTHRFNQWQIYKEISNEGEEGDTLFYPPKE